MTGGRTVLGKLLVRDKPGIIFPGMRDDPHAVGTEEDGTAFFGAMGLADPRHNLLGPILAVLSFTHPAGNEHN